MNLEGILGTDAFSILYGPNGPIRCNATVMYFAAPFNTGDVIGLGWGSTAKALQSYKIINGLRSVQATLTEADLNLVGATFSNYSWFGVRELYCYAGWDRKFDY